mgnify:FL=1
MGTVIADILLVLGVILLLVGIIKLYSIVFSRGFGALVLCIIFPIALLAYIFDDEGRTAWGIIAFGAIAFFLGFFVVGPSSLLR